MALFLLNLASFSRLDDFIIDFFAKEVALITFSFPESAEFPEKINSGKKKVIRTTSFAKKSIVKSFIFEKLAKIKGKRKFLKHQRWLIEES